MSSVPPSAASVSPQQADRSPWPFPCLLLLFYRFLAPVVKGVNVRSTLYMYVIVCLCPLLEHTFADLWNDFAGIVA